MLVGEIDYQLRLVFVISRFHKSAMAEYDVISIGSATQDVFVLSDQARLISIQDTISTAQFLAFEYGAKIAVEHLFISTGGGAANSAIAFAKLGLRAGIVAELGQDAPGDMIEQELLAYGVDVSMLVRNPHLHTGYSVILVGPTGDRTVLTHRGAGTDLTASDVDWERVRETSWIYLGSLTGTAAALWHDVADVARQASIRLAINPGSAQFQEGLQGLGDVLAQTEIIFVNKSEAYRLAAITEQRGEGDEKRALEILHEAGCRLVVMTMGAEGARAYDGRAHYFVPAPEVQVVSNLGAGDAFASACLAALHYGLPVPQALQAGALNAGSVVTSVGATIGLLDWPTIQAQLSG